MGISASDSYKIKFLYVPITYSLNKSIKIDMVIA